MLIALDFDNTFTADPDFWREVVARGRERGHSFVCVTGRPDEVAFYEPTKHLGDEVRAALDGLMPVVFAGFEWKKVAALKAGYKIDVWIDDQPYWIQETHR